MSPPPLELYLFTFNCGRTLVNPSELAPHVFRAVPQHGQLPDMVMFSLQEIAPIAYSFLGGSYLTPYFDQLSSSLHIAAKIRSNGSTTYKLLLTRNLSMTAMMLFATPQVADRVLWTQTAGTGVGLWEMGNKGAVGVRLGYALEGQHETELEMTLVAAHLAPMEDAVQRRNEDWMNIVKRLIFADKDGRDHNRGRRRSSDSHGNSDRQPLLDSLPRQGRHVGPRSLYSTIGHVFFLGDLNYRTAKKSPTSDEKKSFPQPTSDGDSKQSTAQWLKNDQLRQELDAGRTLHGFTEQPVTFPPTYKYNPPEKSADRRGPTGQTARESREPDHWNWATHRFPSWCDRILFLPSGLLEPRVYTALPLQSTSDHRPVALSVSVKLEVPRISDDDIRKHPPFIPEPEWQARRASVRRLEIVVGVLSYLAHTREGNAVLVGVLGGAIGSVLLIRSLLY